MIISYDLCQVFLFDLFLQLQHLLYNWKQLKAIVALSWITAWIKELITPASKIFSQVCRVIFDFPDIFICNVHRVGDGCLRAYMDQEEVTRGCHFTEFFRFWMVVFCITASQQANI
jgi:hypothetical protein